MLRICAYVVSAADGASTPPSAAGHRSVPLPIPSTPRPASRAGGVGSRPPSIELAEYSAAALTRCLNELYPPGIPASRSSDSALSGSP